MLMQELVAQRYVVSLETSGALPTTDVPEQVHTILDVKCPGSGMNHTNAWSNLSRLRTHDEVKFVIADRQDYDYAKGVIAQHHLLDRTTNILLSPVYGELAPDRLVNWMIEDKLPCRLNMQVHKAVWEPSQRGV
jgi:7-carboxy-7-deazaguanine synthase